jgi:hypothetical protein
MKRILGGIVLLLLAGGPAHASLITSSANLPPAGVYLGPNIHQIYGGAALEFLLTLPAHAPIAAEVDRRNGGGGLPGTPADEVETFGSTLTAMLEVKVNGVSQGGPQPISASGPFGSVQTLVLNKIGNTTGTFQTEMLQLNLVGVSPLPFMIRESPTLASLGQTTITDIGGGLFQIDSFFDVFTELSIDGGNNWMPGHGEGSMAPLAGHVELFPLQAVPIPAAAWLFGSALGVMGALRRKITS